MQCHTSMRTNPFSFTFWLGSSPDPRSINSYASVAHYPHSMQGHNCRTGSPYHDGHNKRRARYIRPLLDTFGTQFSSFALSCQPCRASQRVAPPAFRVASSATETFIVILTPPKLTLTFCLTMYGSRRGSDYRQAGTYSVTGGSETPWPEAS